MFLGIEIALADLLIGGGLGVLFLALLLMFRREQTESNYQKSLVDAFENLANGHWDSYKEERHAHRFWLAQAGDADRQLLEAYADLEAESHQREVAEGLVDELEVALRFALDDLEAAEEEIEELEEESDDLEESANEALAGWARADEIAETTLAWGGRILDMAE